MAASTGEVTQEEFDALQVALTALDATVTVLNTAMTTAQSDISDLETDVAALQTTVDGLEDEVTAPQPPSNDDTVIDIDIIGIRIQTGVHDLGNSDTITFPQPFKGGTIPFVTTSILKSVASANLCYYCRVKVCSNFNRCCYTSKHCCKHTKSYYPGYPGRFSLLDSNWTNTLNLNNENLQIY